MVAFVLQVGAYPFGTIDSNGRNNISHAQLVDADDDNTALWKEWRPKLEAWHKHNAIYPSRLSAESEAFLNRIFKDNAVARPTADELLNDQWLAPGPGRYPSGEEMASDMMRRKADAQITFIATDFAPDAAVPTGGGASSGEGAPSGGDSSGDSGSSASASPLLARMRSFVPGDATDAGDAAYRQVAVHHFSAASFRGATPAAAVAALRAALTSAIEIGPIYGAQLTIVTPDAAEGAAGAASDAVAGASAASAASAASEAVIEIVARDADGVVTVRLFAVAKSDASGGGNSIEFERHIGRALSVQKILAEVRTRVAEKLGDTREAVF